MRSLMLNLRRLSTAGESRGREVRRQQEQGRLCVPPTCPSCPSQALWNWAAQDEEPQEPSLAPGGQGVSPVPHSAARKEGPFPEGQLGWEGGPSPVRMRSDGERLWGQDGGRQSCTHSGCDCLSSGALWPGLGSRRLQETHGVTRRGQGCTSPHKHPMGTGQPHFCPCPVFRTYL